MKSVVDLVAQRQDSVLRQASIYRNPPRRQALPFLRAAADALAVVAAVVVASILVFGHGFLAGSVDAGAHPGVRPGWYAAGAVAWLAIVLSTLVLQRLFDEDTLAVGSGQFTRIVRAVLESMAVVAVILFFTRFTISRAWVASVYGLTLAALTVERAAARRALRTLRARGRFRSPMIAVVGDDAAWATALGKIVPDHAIVGQVHIADFVSDWLRGPAGESESDNGPAFLLRAEDFSSEDLWEITMRAGRQRRAIFVRSSVRSVSPNRLTLRPLAGQTFMKVRPPRLSGFQSAQKRVFDILFVLVISPVVLPVVAVVSAAIWLTSGRPIFYRQSRVGRDGELFEVYKFRSMSVDAESSSGPVWASEDDPRRTPMGRFLRRSSLDELPQIWNVLRGDMSVVGPRPERPTFVDSFSREMRWYRYRHRIRPGITGKAQVSGYRGNTSIEARIEHDNWYIEHWSLLLDLRIVMRTVAEIFSGTNAY